MSASLIVANGVSWAMQILVLVAVAGGTLALLRVSDPRLRLRTWHAAVFLSPLLPALGPWRTAASGAVEAAGPGASVIPASWQLWMLGVVVTGIALRTLWLAVGMAKLGGLRSRAAPWCPGWFESLARAIGASAAVGISHEISSAVTFGVRRPSILVPEPLRLAPEPHQRAVVAHELHHVARRDWLWVLAEETVRTVCWWHPAVWFAVSEARLAREELVDRQVIAATDNRAGYLEALLTAADARRSTVAAFVPHFYRRRQLKSRIRRLLKETNMSPRRILASACVIALALPATVWAAGGAFPLVTNGPAAVTQDPPPPPPPAPPSPVRVKKSDDQLPPPPPPPPPAKPVRKLKSVPATAGVPGSPPPPPRKVVKSVKRSGEDVPPPPPRPVKRVSKREGVPGGVPSGVALPPPPAVKKQVTRMPPPPPPPPPKVIKKGGGEDLPPPPPPAPPKVIKKGSGSALAVV